MVFGLSLILVLSTSLQWMQDKWVGVIIVQTLSALPMSFRILSESFSKLEQEIYRSAESLGTGKFQQLFLLEIPAVKKSIALAMATSFGISIGEAGAVLLFESQGKTTLSLWLFKLIGKYQFEEAQGVGLILLLFMLLIFTMKEKWENLR
jgi:ABC-type Fe3+ transport system permease subunit